MARSQRHCWPTKSKGCASGGQGIDRDGRSAGMSQQQEKGFGRRAAARTGAGGEPMPPLFKQIGGIAIGVVIALAIGATFVTVMKQAGRMLDQKFVENATSGAPDEAI